MTDELGSIEELIRRVANQVSGSTPYSSSTIHDRFTLRLCVLSHRTHADRIAEAGEVITNAAAHAEAGT